MNKRNHLLKTIYFLCLCLWVLNLPVSAQETSQGISFFKGTFQEALQKAQAENKMLFIDFYAVWCGPCKMMARETFPKKEVGDYFNEKFISLQLDAEKKENVSLSKKYKVSAFPTCVFLNNNGKAVLIKTGAMNEKELLHSAKIATGEELGFEDLYKKYNKSPDDLKIQQQLLIQAPEFIGALDGMEQEKWLIRIKKLYHHYIDSKMGPELINAEDYNIITTFDELIDDDDELASRLVSFINTNILEWLEVVGAPACYYVIEYNDNQMDKMVRKGDQKYTVCLEKIKGEYKDAYSVIKYKSIDPYTKAKYYYGALYSLYAEKDAQKYIDLMQHYLNALNEDATAEDYGRAAQILNYEMNDKLKEDQHHTSIAWLNKALESKTNVMNQINFLVMIGDSYKALKNYAQSKAYYNQAFIRTHELENMTATQLMMQQAIKSKLAELELLEK